MLCPRASGMLLLHSAPTCADGCWCLVPLIFSNLRWWCFSFQQLAQTLYLHLWWLPSATCACGLFPSTTCTYSNLHCAVVVAAVVAVEVVVGPGTYRELFILFTSLIIYLLYISAVYYNLHCIHINFVLTTTKW